MAAAGVSAGPNQARAFVHAAIGVIDSFPARTPDSAEVYAFGPARIRLVFHSPELHARFGPAFQHLVVDDGPVDLTITLADPAALPVTMPDLPWPPSAYRACGEIPGFVEGPEYSNLDVIMAALSALDETAGRAIYWNRRPAALPSYECAGPLRALLHRFLVRRWSMPMVHAGAVARDGVAALIVGDKGAGKSTTTLSCLAAGLGFLGDDKILLQRPGAERSATVHSAYSCAKVYLDETERFPIAGLAQAVHPPTTADDTKGLVYVSELAPARTSRLVPLDPAIALRTLVSDVVGRFPSTAAQTFSAVARVCRDVPCYRLEAGSDLRVVAETVAGALNPGSM